MVLTLKRWPDPVLAIESRTVEFDKTLKVRDTIVPLLQTMTGVVSDKAAVGLAAIQLGVPLRIIVVVARDAIYRMVNPVITKKSKKSGISKEGCLSLPGELVPVERYDAITVAWQDTFGKKYSAKFKGFEARIVQHEIDHLDGKIIGVGNGDSRNGNRIRA